MIHIVFGSESDKKHFAGAAGILRKKKIEYREFVISAHRATRKLLDYCARVNTGEFECQVILAVAGLSAALPGIIAANTEKPVVACPIIRPPLKGVDAFLSAVQTPTGAPVVSVGIHKKSLENAVEFAIRILNLLTVKTARLQFDKKRELKEK